jgi:hypothetical protein
MSVQRLPNSTLSHRATLFGKVAEHGDHLVAWSLPVRATVLAHAATPKYLHYRVYYATVGVRTAAAAHPIGKSISWTTTPGTSS